MRSSAAAYPSAKNPSGSEAAKTWGVPQVSRMISGARFSSEPLSGLAGLAELAELAGLSALSGLSGAGAVAAEGDRGSATGDRGSATGDSELRTAAPATEAEDGRSD